MKKLFIMLCSLMICGILIFSGCAGSTEAADLGKANVGDYVTFGHYEQDNDLENGKESIEWKVLDKKDGCVLLVSKYGLDTKLYNDDYIRVTWETCTLRSWLNSEFLNTAFSSQEKAAIPAVTLSNPDNPYYGTEGGKDTKDQVFLLSLQEMQQYFTLSDTWTDYDGKDHGETGYNWYLGGSKEVIISPTVYAVAQGAYTTSTYHDAEGKESCWWWLRSPGVSSNYAAQVIDYGTVDASGSEVDASGSDIDYVGFAVRPAIWVNLAS